MAQGISTVHISSLMATGGDKKPGLGEGLQVQGALSLAPLPTSCLSASPSRSYLLANPGCLLFVQVMGSSSVLSLVLEEGQDSRWEGVCIRALYPGLQS